MTDGPYTGGFSCFGRRYGTHANRIKQVCCMLDASAVALRLQAQPEARYKEVVVA